MNYLIRYMRNKYQNNARIHPTVRIQERQKKDSCGMSGRINLPFPADISIFIKARLTHGTRVIA